MKKKKSRSGMNIFRFTCEETIVVSESLARSGWSLACLLHVPVTVFINDDYLVSDFGDG